MNNKTKIDQQTLTRIQGDVYECFERGVLRTDFGSEMIGLSRQFDQAGGTSIAFREICAEAAREHHIDPTLIPSR